jgi:hypothetical protein
MKKTHRLELNYGMNIGNIKERHRLNNCVK